MGEFLDEFDCRVLQRQSLPEKANELLFEWIQSKRDALFAELWAERPVLEFWSKHPGNPDIGQPGDPPIPLEDGPGYAYLLTRREHVEKALADCSMRPTHRSGMFILSMDDVKRHADARGEVHTALQDPGVEAKMDQAIDGAWATHVGSAAAGASLDFDVRAFAREAALRFAGKYIGIPEEAIFDDPPHNLEHWSLEAYRSFIWKIHARHFVDFDQTAAHQALGKIGEIVGNSFEADPAADTVIGRLFRQQGALNEPHKLVNAVGAIQGLVDNAMTGICYALNQFLLTASSRDAARQARHDLVALKHLMRNAHREDTFSPFLPRRGPLSKIYETADNRVVDMACAIGAAMNDPQAGSGPWDIRFGFGMHACVGALIGDELMARALARILELENLKVTPAPGALKKDWGWIVKQHVVPAKVP